MKENTAMEQVGSGADRLDSFFTRRGFVKVSGAFVAGMVALGLLPDSAAAAPTSSKGEVDYYATPAHVLKVNRARCTGCQRCEMMCTLQNDGASQPAAARIHVHDGFNFGSDWESFDGIYYSCEWQIRACTCAQPLFARRRARMGPSSPWRTARAPSTPTSVWAAVPASPPARGTCPW